MMTSTVPRPNMAGSGEAADSQDPRRAARPFPDLIAPHLTALLRIMLRDLEKLSFS